MSNKRDKCAVCRCDDFDKNNILYGDWLQEKDISVHYFCLLSADNLPQKGKKMFQVKH